MILLFKSSNPATEGKFLALNCRSVVFKKTLSRSLKRLELSMPLKLTITQVYQTPERKKGQMSDLKEESKKHCPSSHSQGLTCQTTSTDDNSTPVKINHCFYCNQPHYSMMAHLQSVHPNEPEVAEALAFNKSSQEKNNLLELLQTRGNVIHITKLKSKKKLRPCRTFASDCSVDDQIYCIYCLRLFNKKSFARHLEQCKGKSIPSVEARGDGQTGGGNLQLKFPENVDGFESKSVNFVRLSQKATDWKNEELSLLMCDIDQESTNASGSHASSVRAHSDTFRSPWENFSPPELDQTMSDNKTSKSVKARTSGRKKRRKRRSLVQNQSLIMDSDLLVDGETLNSKTHVCQYCKATFSSPYTLRRHEYTHTGERPFWCHECNVGFIQRYRLVKHMLTYHGDTFFNSDQEKPKRTKRKIQGGETSVTDQTVLEPLAISPEDLPDVMNDDTEEIVAATNEDVEEREFNWEEAGHSEENDYNTDCYKFLFTS